MPVVENTQTLLIVDDDRDIRELLAETLMKYHYNVLLARDGKEMFSQLEKNNVDLIILDIMLPGDDGFALCRQIRMNSLIPIIMLTAIGEETDRIVGLEVGADDYLAKPFNPRELVARIKAVLRRSGDNLQAMEKRNHVESAAKQLHFADWILDLGTRRLISTDNLEISMSAGEFNLLATFLQYPKRVLSRDQLLDLTCNRTAGPYDRSIDIQVSRIRQKIEKNHKDPKIIITVRGGGYMLNTNVSVEQVTDSDQQ